MQTSSFASVTGDLSQIPRNHTNTARGWTVLLLAFPPLSVALQPTIYCGPSCSAHTTCASVGHGRSPNSGVGAQNHYSVGLLISPLDQDFNRRAAVTSVPALFIRLPTKSSLSTRPQILYSPLIPLSLAGLTLPHCELCACSSLSPRHCPQGTCMLYNCSSQG